jgi:SAM-dependent methyltransferase
MASGTSPFVDYGTVAPRYAAERALSSSGLVRWRTAAVAQLPARPLVVADIGSGTGIFARAWADWTAAHVVGVEPSAAMLGSAASTRRARVSYVRGVAEALPLADRSVDVAWMSTVFHHLADRRVAAHEMARVLSTDGRVLLRGLVRDLTPTPWLEAFPGRDKALARYATLAQVESVFSDAGLTLLDTCQVQESPRTNRERADWIVRMRDADSILTALTDDEIAAGVQAMRERPDEVVPIAVSLVTFAR